MASAAANCNTLSKNDLVRCPAAGARVTVETAHREHHSFGGKMPAEIEYGKILKGIQESVYPLESYIHYENRATCDTCGHSCLSG